MGEAANNRRQQDRDHPDRCRRQTRPGGGIAIHLLQQLRQQNNRAEVEHIGEADTQAADGEVSRLKEREIDDRVVVRQLPDDQEAYRHHRDNGQDDDLLRVEPVELFTAVEHDLQTADTQDQQRQPDAVDTPLFGARLSSPQRLQRHQYHDGANRYVDEEDPAPVVVIADVPAQNRSADRRDDNGHRPERQRDGTFCGRVVTQQQTLGERDQRPRDNPLNDAEENQHRQAAGHAARPRGQNKRHRGPEEQLHLTDALCQPAGDRNGDGVCHPKRGNDPGPLAQRRAKVTGDGRDRHVCDGGVQHLHECRQRQRDGHNDQLRAFQRFLRLLLLHNAHLRINRRLPSRCHRSAC